MLYGGRLYLCATKEDRQLFLKNPEQYAKAGVAEDGFCVHCLRETGLLVRGDPRHEVARQGRRYWFPDADHRVAFLESEALKPGRSRRQAVGHEDRAGTFPTERLHRHRCLPDVTVRGRYCRRTQEEHGRSGPDLRFGARRQIPSAPPSSSPHRSRDPSRRRSRRIRRL